jgi:hypothetical protein
VIAAAAALQADLLLLAGDSFDNPRVRQPVLDEAGRLLAGAPMPVVMLPGNHDPLLERCIFRRAGLDGLGHVRVIGLHAPESLLFADWDLEVRGKAPCQLRGHGPPARPRAAAGGRQIPWRMAITSRPRTGRPRAIRSWKLTAEAIAATGADYLALGHWERAAPAGDGRVPAFYSGSPGTARTLNLVLLAPDGAATVTREALPGA